MTASESGMKGSTFRDERLSNRDEGPSSSDDDPRASDEGLQACPWDPRRWDEGARARDEPRRDRMTTSHRAMKGASSGDDALSRVG